MFIMPSMEVTVGHRGGGAGDEERGKGFKLMRWLGKRTLSSLGVDPWSAAIVSQWSAPCSGRCSQCQMHEAGSSLSKIMLLSFGK